MALNGAGAHVCEACYCVLTRKHLSASPLVHKWRVTSVVHDLSQVKFASESIAEAGCKAAGKVD
jgi:hypothetical protein